MQGNFLWVSFYTLLRKEVRRFMRIWAQTLLPPAITMTLYFIVFGALIGPKIGEMRGANYITYIAPGLIMMAVITNSYNNVVSSFFGNKFQRSIQELLVSPTPAWVVLGGYIGGSILRGILVGFIVSLVALFFTNLPIYSFFTICAVIVITAMVFSFAGLINAVFAQNFDHISIIPTFVLTPLTYLGGVFYSVDLLAEPWQSLSRLNPILYMVNAFRYGFLGITDVPLVQSFALLMIFCLVLGGICYWLLVTGKGVRS